MNDMSDIVFKTTEDQQNFEKAKKLLKRTLKLFHADGGIGIAQDQHQKSLSYEFIINLNNVPVNFGTCLTTYELLEKSKLYHELVKDSITSKIDIYENCASKAQSNPSYRPLMIDLQIASGKVKHIYDLEQNSMPSKLIH
jgi:hypothetical protein